MSEEKKKRYYYGKKEKKASEMRKEEGQELASYSYGEIQRDFNRMMHRFQREFDDFWEIPSRLRHGLRWRHRFPMLASMETMMPSVDLEDRGKDFRLTVDLPGFTKKDVEIEVDDDSVAVHAKRTESDQEKKTNYVRHERTAQTFYRKIQLPEGVRPDDVKASLDAGLLEIILPKKEPKETKKVTIT